MSTWLRKKEGRVVGYRTARQIFFLGSLTLVSCFPKIARSADICRAIALRDVAAIESPNSIISKGKYDESITQYNINKKTKMASFCSHGDFCYPTHVFVNNKKQEALRLTNCTVGAKAFEDAEQISYEIRVDRKRNSIGVLRESDIADRFRAMGLCSACADNMADSYVHKPSSECGNLAKQALEGNPVAVDKLNGDFFLTNSCRF